MPESIVELLEGNREKCYKCGKNKMLYCDKCLVPTCKSEHVPNIKLPLFLNLIHHSKEKSSKSSALPIKVIAPETTKIIYFPENMDYFDKINPKTTAVLFPSVYSRELAEFKPEELKLIDSVLVVDCTWY